MWEFDIFKILNLQFKLHWYSILNFEYYIIIGDYYAIIGDHYVIIAIIGDYPGNINPGTTYISQSIKVTKFVLPRS